MSAEAIKAKSAIVDEITEKLTNAQSSVVFEYRGLTVAEVTQLRRDFRAEGVELKVYKNTLVQRATEKAGYADINDQLSGPNAIAFGNNDAVAPARILAKFAKEHEAVVIKAGVVEGKVLDANGIKDISSLPSREGMYSMLLAMMKEPVAKVARVIQAIADKQNEGEGAEAAPEAE